MNEDYDKIYEIVVMMAKVKMSMNSFKGRIEDIDTDVLINAGRMEFMELKEAMIMDDNYMGVLEEAADVLNFAVAAACKAVKKYRVRKKDEQRRPDIV